ncbi:nonstructural protein [Bulbul coronavirus HKU11]|uniref:Nonstructural protein n=2 Tax=Bulbul coronavirus HKU11 TaxID=574549 RepID=B6VDX5_9NIDO|nr:nonstructural protein [Bulbul coronavirus HKU11-934]ACJ12041.1 nonstructural protein [Bulbul coronavirus HKU11-934]ACJ12050.1 nonstructural protein [Bulbul coronavirus HKU11-796]
MGTSQSTTNVNNQITNIQAAHGSSVQTYNQNKSHIEVLLQQGMPFIALTLLILCLVQSVWLCYCCRRNKTLNSRLRAVQPRLLP